MGPGERLQFVFRRALFEGQGNLISRLQTLNSEPKTTGNSLLAINNLLAEREGFEPPLPFRVNLISSQAPSAGLGHLSALVCFRLLCLKRLKKPSRIAEQSSANIPPTTGSLWFIRASLQS